MPESFVQRLRQLLSTRKLPAWLVILILIIERIPDWKSRIDFWVDAARHSGGALSVIAAVVASPYFDVALLLAAIAYLLFVGEPTRGVQRHPGWLYTAWIVSSLCATAIVVTVVLGGIEIYIREETARRVGNILHDGSNPRVSPQPHDAAFDFNRRLSPDQFRALMQEASKLKRFSSSWLVTIPPNDSEANNFRYDIDQALTRAGLEVREAQERPEGPEQTGVMIPVRDVHNPGSAAEELRRVLELIGIVPTYVSRPSMFESEQYILFIGPKPL